MSDNPIQEAALAQFTAAMKESQSQGYISGYIAGRTQVISRLQELIDHLKAESLDSLVNHTTSRIVEHMNKAESGRPPREGSDQNAVLQTIRNEPGLRGVDIASKLANSVHERTVRTSLHRLKTRGLIEPRDGKWWPLKVSKAREMLNKIEDQSAPTD